MKKIILDFQKKQQKYKELVQEAFNNNFLDFLISRDTFQDFKDIDRVTLYSKDKTLSPNVLICSDNQSLKESIQFEDQKLGYYKKIKEKEDVDDLISKKNTLDFVIVSAEDWKIIPFENLIAQMQGSKTKIIAEVKDLNEAELMLNVLEVGVDGILFFPDRINQISELKKFFQSYHQIDIKAAEIVNIQQISEGERVCVDTSSLLQPGEGMLIGSTAKGFVLVHAEVFETKFVSSRPFRVNAGDVSAYILVPSENSETYSTKYLSELKGGDKVLIANKNGTYRVVSIARVKIETRPMIRFELISTQEDAEVTISIICQNAETIRLIDKEGNAKSVVDIKEGDQILVHIGPGATHFGTAIDEKIIEK
jgi:3-dehydroquinate synthase II